MLVQLGIPTMIQKTISLGELLMREQQVYSALQVYPGRQAHRVFWCVNRALDHVRMYSGSRGNTHLVMELKNQFTVGF